MAVPSENKSVAKNGPARIIFGEDAALWFFVHAAHAVVIEPLLACHLFIDPRSVAPSSPSSPSSSPTGTPERDGSGVPPAGEEKPALRDCNLCGIRHRPGYDNSMCPLTIEAMRIRGFVPAAKIEAGLRTALGQLTPVLPWIGISHRGGHRPARPHPVSRISGHRPPVAAGGGVKPTPRIHRQRRGTD